LFANETLPQSLTTDKNTGLISTYSG
jgi:hypothetical protein